MAQIMQPQHSDDGRNQTSKIEVGARHAKCAFQRQMLETGRESEVGSLLGAALVIVMNPV
jgi:hypothetical protein